MMEFGLSRLSRKETTNSKRTQVDIFYLEGLANCDMDTPRKWMFTESAFDETDNISSKLQALHGQVILSPKLGPRLPNLRLMKSLMGSRFDCQQTHSWKHVPSLIYYKNLKIPRKPTSIPKFPSWILSMLSRSGTRTAVHPPLGKRP
jgi:hypothetical protein